MKESPACFGWYACSVARRGDGSSAGKSKARAGGRDCGETRGCDAFLTACKIPASLFAGLHLGFGLGSENTAKKMPNTEQYCVESYGF
jgi:hypothetical protein